MSGAFLSTSWAFMLHHVDSLTKRLIVRKGVDYKPSFLIGPFAHLSPRPLPFVMERRQLIGCKQRAEQAWGATQDPALA